MERIGVIGFGFSGLMTVAKIVRAAASPCILYIIEDGQGFGVAYGTQNPEHLLNVRAGGMSAWEDAPDDFVQWLKSADAAKSKAKHSLEANYGADDFLPRVLYGAYLEFIWRDTQTHAAEKKLEIKLVPSRAVAVQHSNGLAVLSERGDAIAVDKIVLAAGHEVKPIFAHIKSSHIIQNPWAVDALARAANWQSPVLLIGTGLTAVDMVLSLRRAGYTGEIIATSRRGLLPQPHATPTAIFSFTPQEISTHQTLRTLLPLVRKKIREVGDWRVVVDALRPHTQTIWQRLGTPDQQRFLKHLSPIWNIHRHRMAHEIAARLDTEIVAGTLRIIASKKLDVQMEDEKLFVAINTTAQRVSRILNCTGLELDLARSGNPLLRQLLADGMLEPHANGLGVASDRYRRAWGVLHPNLYVIGSLLTGQLLESTAVPELRVQAAMVVQALNLTLDARATTR